MKNFQTMVYIIVIFYNTEDMCQIPMYMPIYLIPYIYVRM